MRYSSRITCRSAACRSGCGRLRWKSTSTSSSRSSHCCVLSVAAHAPAQVFCTIACIVTLGLRLFLMTQIEDLIDMHVWTHTRIDSILFGAILACYNNPVMDGRDRLPGRWVSYLIGLAMLAATFVIREDAFRYTVRYSIQGLALLLLFNAAIRDASFARRILDSWPMRVVALLSYTLYLVHSLIVHAAQPLTDRIGHAPTMLGALLVSFVIAWGVYVAIERPLGQWRRRVERGWRTRPSAAEVDMAEPGVSHAEASAQKLGSKSLGPAG